MTKKIEYTVELAREICDTLATGTDGLVKLCKRNATWPGKDVVFRWIIENDDFAQMYARAKRLQVEALIDELLDIADDSSQDIIETDKGFKYDHEHINRARLKVDTRKWIAAKLMPQLYGDKIIQELTQNTSDQVREIAHKCKKE